MTQIEFMPGLSQVSTGICGAPGDDIPQYCDWFYIMDDACAGKYNPIHISMMEDGKTIAACNFYVQVDDLHHTLEERLFGRFKRSLNALGLTLTPSLVSFSPLTSTCGLVCWGNAGKREDAARAFARDAQELAKREKVRATAFLYLSDEDAALIQGLKKEGYQQCFMGFNAVIDIPFKNFDEYLTAIKSKSHGAWRQIRSDMKRGTKDGVVIRPEAEITEELSCGMKMMLDNVFSKYYNGKKANLPDRFFKEIKTRLGERAIIFIARKDGEPIGFSFFLAERHKWYACFVGHRHELTRNNGTYFNVLYHIPIMEAIGAGVSSMNYGMGVGLTKVRRGCRLKPLYMLIRAHRIPHSLLIRSIMKVRNWTNIRKERKLLAEICREHTNLTISELAPNVRL